MFIRTWMTKDVVSIEPDASISTAWKRMLSHRIRRLPVTTQNEELIGLLSRTDLMRNSSGEGLLQRERNDKKVSETMTRNVVCCYPGTPVENAARAMFHKQVACLPVINKDRKLRGIVTQYDMFRVLVKILDPVPGKTGRVFFTADSLTSVQKQLPERLTQQNCTNLITWQDRSQDNWACLARGIRETSQQALPKNN